MLGREVLTVRETQEADRLTAESSVPLQVLMENAGKAVADQILERFEKCRTVILCGPGNNGGDGFVVARYLALAGWSVRVVQIGHEDGYTEEARHHRGQWAGPIEAAEDIQNLDDQELFVDALFGAGLSRPIEGAASDFIEMMRARPVVSIDIPSGIHGDTGEVLGSAPMAALTVTFFRTKPAHYLVPGVAHCGEVVCVDIGIEDSVLETIAPEQCVNGPDLWLGAFPKPAITDHKYSRGFVLVVGGTIMTGAARLAARAAQRAGAGAVQLAVPGDVQTIYKVTNESIMVAPFRDTATLQDLVEEESVSTSIVGPGLGVVGATRERVAMVARSGKPAVIDADGLSVFEDNGQMLFDMIKGPCVLTPHEGEFRRLFPDLTGGRLFRARAAAARSGAVVLLKGFDTVVADPEGRVVINNNGTPDAATAGSGDVLAGIIGGLMAQGMPAFESACAGAWIHADAACRFGAGLIAEDIIDTLPAVLADLRDQIPA